MMENNLRSILLRASTEVWALGHFNISNLEQLRAIVNVGVSLQAPLHIGTSEGERHFIGLKQAVHMVRAFREETGIPIFLNADHSKSVEEARAAVDAGYDSVHVDLSAMSFEENVRGTQELVKYAKSKNPDISIEGELGYFRGKSEVQKEIIEIKPEDLTNIDQAKEFVERTQVDRLAPVVGNIHGIAANEPKLDIDLIKKLHKELPNTILVLHGGSGIPDDQMKEAAKSGISNIHVNTEIRLAYTNALREVIKNKPDETTPYKLFPDVISAVEDKVKEKLLIFGSLNKI